MKPIDIFSIETKDICANCKSELIQGILSETGRFFLCRIRQRKESGVFVAEQIICNEPCTLKDWEVCQYNVKGVK